MKTFWGILAVIFLLETTAFAGEERMQAWARSIAEIQTWESRRPHHLMLPSLQEQIAEQMHEYLSRLNGPESFNCIASDHMDPDHLEEQEELYRFQSLAVLAMKHSLKFNQRGPLEKALVRWAPFLGTASGGVADSTIESDYLRRSASLYFYQRAPRYFDADRTLVLTAHEMLGHFRSYSDDEEAAQAEFEAQVIEAKRQWLSRGTYAARFEVMANLYKRGNSSVRGFKEHLLSLIRQREDILVSRKALFLYMNYVMAMPELSEIEKIEASEILNESAGVLDSEYRQTVVHVQRVLLRNERLYTCAFGVAVEGQ